MPKRKSKTRRTAKTRRTSPTKRTDKKYKIPKPSNIRKLDDDTVIISSNESPKQVSGSFRKSFHELTKEDLDREYSAAIDYKPNTSNTLHQVDIQRGFTGAESNSGRAFVNTRVDRNDEITMHNHPDRNDIDAKWTRPSGTDINNIIWLKDEGYNLKASYVKSAEGRYIRYRVVDLHKARRQAQDAKRSYYSLTTEKEREKYSGAADYAIEQEFFRIYQNEVLLSHKKTTMNPKILLEIDKREKQAIQELKDIEDDPKLTDRQKDVKIQEMSAVWLERQVKYDKRHTRKNKKYIKKGTSYRKRELMIQRRSFNEWQNFMLYSWGIEVKRMPKGFKDPIDSGGT